MVDHIFVKTKSIKDMLNVPAPTKFSQYGLKDMIGLARLSEHFSLLVANDDACILYYYRRCGTLCM